MRLLLVEDDAMIGASIRTGRRQDGYTVDWVRDGADVRLDDAPGGGLRVRVEFPAAP